MVVSTSTNHQWVISGYVRFVPSLNLDTQGEPPTNNWGERTIDILTELGEPESMCV
jgi:hypothetical protein